MSTPAAANQWEGSLRPFWIMAIVAVVLLIATYRFVVPALVSAAAASVPQGVVDVISTETLAALDRSVFMPTQVPDARRARLTARFGGLRAPGGRAGATYRILFRRSDELGANAMALPSGTIVVTDDLMALSGDDDDLIPVLAHEAGHVAARHGMRQLFQSSVIALAATWLLGDISMLAAAAPAALLQAKYSRDLEREADRYALTMLDGNQIPRERFARILERLQASARARGEGDDGGLLSYLSSHPVTSERIAAVRRGD